MMKQPLNKGVSFGLTSGAITTLGLMVGLHSETKSAAVVLGGILTIAVADAFSDALGIHISEKGENQHASPYRRRFPARLWASLARQCRQVKKGITHE